MTSAGLTIGDAVETVFQSGLTVLHSHQQHVKVPHSPQNLLSCASFILALLVGMKWYLIAVLIFMVLMINDVEHVFMSLLTICVFSLVRCLFKSIAYFRIGLLPLVFLMGSTLVCQEAQRARGMHGQKALLEISREGMGEAGGTG